MNAKPLTLWLKTCEPERAEATLQYFFTFLKDYFGLPEDMRLVVEKGGSKVLEGEVRDRTVYLYVGVCSDKAMEVLVHEAVDYLLVSLCKALRIAREEGVPEYEAYRIKEAVVEVLVKALVSGDIKRALETRSFPIF